VLLMDESHRYRAQAGMRAINELKPLFGLEGNGANDYPNRHTANHGHFMVAANAAVW